MGVKYFPFSPLPTQIRVNEKLYISETSHKLLYKNEIQCQAIYNKMTLDPMQHVLNNPKKLGEVLISIKTLFKKQAIVHEKDQFSKIKPIICNIP